MLSVTVSQFVCVYFSYSYSPLLYQTVPSCYLAEFYVGSGSCRVQVYSHPPPCPSCHNGTSTFLLPLQQIPGLEDRGNAADPTRPVNVSCGSLKRDRVTKQASSATVPQERRREKRRDSLQRASEMKCNIISTSYTSIVTYRTPHDTRFPQQQQKQHATRPKINRKAIEPR